MSEDHRTFPMTVYGASKLAGECYVRAYWETYRYPVTILRPFNAFGPRCGPARLAVTHESPGHVERAVAALISPDVSAYRVERGGNYLTNERNSHAMPSEPQGNHQIGPNLKVS